MAAPGSTALAGVLRRELLPYEGRYAASLRMAAACVLTVAVAMSQQIPEAALSCYLVFFATKKDAGAGIAIAAGLIVAATAGIGLGIVFLELASDEPMLRLGLVAAFTFGGMYFAQASRLGPMAATVGFVFAFALTLLDIVPVPELMSRALAWMWLVVFVPMFMLIVLNVLAGANPAILLRKGVSGRLRIAAEALEGENGAADRSRDSLRRGVAELEGFARTGKLLGFLSGKEGARLLALARETQRLLAVLLAAPAGFHDAAAARQVAAIADAVDHRALTRPALVSPPHLPHGVAQSLSRLLAISRGELPAEPSKPGEKAGLLHEDAFTNPAYLRFALKASLAVFVTYLIYTGWDWFDIHTAMITVFYVSLGTAGETLHKAMLRLLGCVVGGAMGIGSILFLMPHMTDIGHLMLLVGVGSFIAAWVSNGSERVQYMGWQMALAFFLCVLPGFGPGFGPTFDTGAATNRLIGIIIGNLVVTAVFVNLWPVSVVGKVADTAAAAIAVLRRSLVTPASDYPTEAITLAAEGRRLAELSLFEPSPVRADGRGVARDLGGVLDRVEDAASLLVRLDEARATPRYLVGTPKGVRSAMAAYEASAAGFLDAARAGLETGDAASISRLDAMLEEGRRNLSRVWRLSRQRRRSTPGGWTLHVRQTAAIYAGLQDQMTRALEAMRSTKAYA